MTEPTEMADAEAAPDDTRVYDAYIAGRQSAALAAALRIGLFDALARNAQAPDELAVTLGVATRGVRALARGLTAMGLLHVDTQARLVLSPDAAAYLVRGRELWMGGLIDLEVEHFLSPALLLEALSREGASVYDGEDPWQRHARDPAQARAFTSAMHGISVLPARRLARAVDCTGVRRVLDVGGGSGALSLALVEQVQELVCTLWELPSVCDIAREFIEARGAAGRVSILPGDFWSDTWPAGHDAILFSQILHDWPPERGRVLLERACAVLPEGGRIWIHEKLVDDAGSGPLANALVDLDMLVWTEGQQYTREGLWALLESTGFEPLRSTPGHGYWSIVEARKR